MNPEVLLFLLNSFNMPCSRILVQTRENRTLASAHFPPTQLPTLSSLSSRNGKRFALFLPTQTFPVSQIPLALGGIPSPLFLGPNGECYKETFEVVPCHIFSKCFLYPCCKMNILLDETLLTFRKLLGEGQWAI